jgi:hypothetical protein
VKLQLRNVRRRSNGGMALVIAVLLLLIVSVLGISGLSVAALELQMAGNVQYQERAFQAAEFAIEQALNSPPLSTDYTLASPARVPVTGELALPGSGTDTYSYRLYYDTSAGSTPIPGGAAAGLTDLAFHFVIESAGSSARGAHVKLTQGFYVLAPAPCGFAGAACTFATGARHRAYWIQDGAE